MSTASSIQIHFTERLSLSKFPPQDFPGYSRPPNVAGFPHDRNGMRGGHLRSGRGGDHASERREYRGEERSFEEAQRHPPPRRPDYHRHPPDFRGNPLYAGESGGRDRSDRGRKPMDASRFDRPDFARESRDYRSKEEEGKGDLFRCQHFIFRLFARFWANSSSITLVVLYCVFKQLNQRQYGTIPTI